MPALVASFLPVGLVFYVYRGHSFHEQWSNLFGTLAFQQGIFTDSFAENSPYWSLANEGYYYLIYPLLWMTMRKIGNLPGLLLFGSLALVLCFAAPIRNAGTLAIFYPVWLAGVFLAVTLREGRKWTTVWLGIMVLVILASMATSLGERLHPRWNQPLWHTLSGVSLASVLYLWLRVIQVDRVSTRVRKALNTLGEISYSLYLTHFVVITAVATRWPHAKDSFLSAAASSLLAVAASLALGRALYRAVERPFLAS